VSRLPRPKQHGHRVLVLWSATEIQERWDHPGGNTVTRVRRIANARTRETALRVAHHEEAGKPSLSVYIGPHVIQGALRRKDSAD